MDLKFSLEKIGLQLRSIEFCLRKMLSFWMALGLFAGSALSLPADSATALLAKGSTDYNWHIDIVDGRAFDDLGSRSLALDTSGHAHIAYGKNHLYYAWNDGSAWHLETVDDLPAVGYDTSLALDSNNHPHISYFDDRNGDLKYAHHDGTSWHIQTVDSAGTVGWYSSLVLDGNYHPHISYYDELNYDLKYAYHDGSTWHIQTVDSAGSVGEYTALALDSPAIRISATMTVTTQT